MNQLNNKQQEPTKFLGTFTIAMLCVSAIISLRNLPTTALLGPQTITFFVAAGICFFIPVALVCAELASGWPQEGGVYLWIEAAFGANWGFLAVWLQWMESVVWLPTILSFIAGTTAYLINPELEQSRTFLVTTMFIVLWGTTFLNFKGLKTSSHLSTLGVILGTILPGIVLIALGWSALFNPETEHMLSFTAQNLLPKSEFSALVTFTAILLGLCGMEIPAYHIKHVLDPKRSFPKAIFLATVIILGIYIFGSLAIAAVIPKEHMSLIAGPIQAFHLFFSTFGLNWATPLLAALTLVGSLAILNTWIIGPSKGLLSTSKEGYLPTVFLKVNKQEVPTALLYLQGICGSVLISLFVFNKSIHAAYWMINTLAAQLYLVMYFILFLAAIKLRYCKPQVKRMYQIPGGKFGISVVAGLGALACLLTFLVGFIRPTDIVIHHSAIEYAAYLFIGMLICSAPPFIFLWQQRK